MIESRVGRLGPLAIAASSAIAAISQISTSGFSVALTQVAAVRVGFHLGRGDARGAQMAMWIVLVGALIINLGALFLVWPLALPISRLITVSDAVQHATALIAAASFVNGGLSVFVGILTSGVLGGQGRA